MSQQAFAAPDAQHQQDELDLLPDGLLVADHAGTVVRANRAAARLLGQDRLVGRPVADVLTLQDLSGRDWLAVTAPYTGLGTRRGLVECACRLPDGTELLVTATIVRPSPREPVQWLGISLRSARARSRLERERSDLVATMAHELRSPLTGVKGFTATLLARWDKFTDDQKKLVLQSVHRDTDRLTRLISELLEVARIDTGRLSLHPRPLDVAEHLAAVVDSVRAGTPRELRFDPPADLPPVWADPDRFVQVATNLVENAVRHGDGTVEVGVRGRREVLEEGQPPVDVVAVVVEDEGSGIPPELRQRVFTKYWKHGARGGSGLGMYIAHGLVTAQRGRILIGEAVGGGARVETLWRVHPPALDQE